MSCFPLMPEVVPRGGRNTIMETLAELGLTAGLKIVLDAGDASSVGSSAPQTWSDASGNGEDFFVGASGAVESDEPLFAGSIGGKSREYFSNQNTRELKFTYKKATKSAWINALHKRNGSFTFGAWVETSGGGTFGVWTGTAGYNRAGIFFRRDPILSTLYDNALRLYVTNGSGVILERAGPIVRDGRYFIGLSYSDVTGTGFFQVNRDSFPFTGKYSSPNTTNTPEPLYVLGHTYAQPVGVINKSFGGFVFNSALTGADMIRIHDATRKRFGV